MIASFFGGILFGLFWEIFRIIRRAYEHRAIWVLFEDVAFFIVIAFSYFFLCFAFANGNLRWYSFLCCAIGFVIYLLTFGKLLTKLSNCIILLVGKVFTLLWRVIKRCFVFAVSPLVLVYNLLLKFVILIKRSLCFHRK